MDVEAILQKLQPEHATVLKDAMAASAKEATDLKAVLSTEQETVTAQKQSIDTLTADLTKSNEALTAIKAELDVLKAKTPCSCDGETGEDGVCKSCGLKKDTAFDETEVLKGLPAGVKEYFEKLKTQKETAEAQIQKALEDKKQAEAMEKAAKFKAIPMPQEKLAALIKSAPTDLVDLLGTVNTALEQVVLTEKGRATGGASDNSAWEQIEKKAKEMASTSGLTHQQAIAAVLKQNPDLYTQYLNGGTE